MSMEQVRAQRALLDATDLEREADENIVRLESELERWQRIKQNAQACGATALAAITGETIPQVDTQNDAAIDE